MLLFHRRFACVVLAFMTTGLLYCLDKHLPLLLPLSLIHNYRYMLYRHHKKHQQKTIEYLKLRGINYTPRKGPASLNDVQKECKSITEIQADFDILHQLTDYFHLYALAECSQARIIIPIAKRMNVNLFLNIWIDGSPLNSTTGSFASEMHELDYLMENEMINADVIQAISVGSESYHRHETTIEENIAYCAIVRDSLNRHNITNIPLTVTDIDKTFMQFPELMEAVDFPSINAFPFFDPAYGKKKANGAISYLIHDILDPLIEESHRMEKPLFLTETGW